MKYIEHRFIEGFSRCVSQIMDMERFLGDLAALISEGFGTKRCTIFILEDEYNHLKLKVESSLSRDMIPSVNLIRLKRDEPADDIDPLNKHVILPLSIKGDISFNFSQLIIPLINKGRFMGLLCLSERIAGGVFEDEEIRLLCVLSDFLSSILSHILLDYRLLGEYLYHKSVVDNVPTGIISIDVEGNVNLFNRAAEEILGIQRIDILGRNVSIFQDKLASLLLDTLYTGKRYRREEIFLLPQRILIGVSSSQIYNEKGEIVGAGITFTDLSKIKKEENLQRQKEQMKFWDRLSTFLCHEIKNSILSTTTLTQLLPQKYDDEEFRQTFLSSIMRDTARLDRLTERIKEFANSRVLKPVEGDLLDVLNEAIKDSLQDWKSKSIDIALEIKNRGGVKIPIDYFWLKEAFYNILINALEALGEGGRIRVCVEELPHEIDEPRLFLGDGMVKVTIEDDGPGISQENLPMVLEPFFSTKEGRIGLGLAISMNVIEGHGGSISINSRWGEGTRVSIYLPKKRRE